MGIEGSSSNNEVQNQEINQSTNEQIEQNQAEHQRSGEELEGNSTIDNEGERKQIEGKDDATESSEGESSQLDNEDSIENDTSQEQPTEREFVSPEQPLDNQDRIDGVVSSTDEMSENDQEITDSLDLEDSIEDEDSFETKSLEESEASTKGLDQDNFIEDNDLNAENDAEKDIDKGNESLESDNTDNVISEDTKYDSENTEEAVADREKTVEDTEKLKGERKTADESKENVEVTEEPEEEGEAVEESEKEKETLETTEEPKEEGESGEKPEKDDESTEKSKEDSENAENIEADKNDKPEDFVAKESSDSDDNNERGNISKELKDTLEPFEQSKWENMTIEQKKEAAEHLRDSVAEGLGLQEKPDVRYYNNEDEGDFGGYSPSENAIYINEYNIGDAKETADTIAHESRHCWQHEMAESFDGPQAKEFKENFDDYIRPEDDYRGYRNQPVEADAREYARNITDNIPDNNESDLRDSSTDSTNIYISDSDIRQNDEKKSTGFDGIIEKPTDIENKVDNFESKVKEPEDYASKFEHDTQQKLEDYYKSDEGKLTKEQKEQLVSDLKSSYDRENKSERGDILVPENSKDITSVYYNGRTGKYDVGYDWKPVDTVPESRKMEILHEGQQFDRVGAPSGRCTGAVGEDGSCATVKERSIPYHFTEDDITQEPSYHRYEAEQDFTRENLSNAIDNSMYSDEKKAEMHANLDKYYENAQVKGYGNGDGLASGEIAPMFEETTGATGGGKQYDMPFSMEELDDIGMISEIPRERY